MTTTQEPEAPPPPPVLDYAPPPRNWFQRAQAWLREQRPEFQVGTLRYTGFSLMMVFLWLLWGDFCYALLEENLPSVLPLKLNELGAGDTMNAVLNKTFAYSVVFFLAPVVSFRSDRTRTRWGRRIPYLFWSAPFMGFFLILIGLYEPLTRMITGGADQVMFLGYTVSRTTVAVTVIGVLIDGSDLAGIFANTVYYYLFNDVVPPGYISRFLALFRIVAGLANIAFNAFILPHSMTHFQTIFIIAGIAYAGGFMLMCIFVREGDYPPPPPNIDGRKGIISAVKTYAVECFTHRLYWWFFLANTCYMASKLATMFLIIRNTKSLGLSLTEIGTYFAWVAGIAMALQYPAGWVADRFHPVRVYVVSRAWEMLGTLCFCLWIFVDFGPRGNLLYLYIIGLTFMPIAVVANAAELPMYMRILPRDRFGQFCSANAMIRAFVAIFGSMAAGAFIGSMAPWWGDRRYTWVAGWQLIFQFAGVLFLILLYAQWKARGGMKSYTPPEIPTAGGFEVLPRQ